VPAPERDLTTVEFVAWLANHSATSFDDAYRAVASAADRLQKEAASVRHARSHRRNDVTRADLAAAMASYYDLQGDGAGLYRVSVAGVELTLSLLVEPSWIGANVALGSPSERISFEADAKAAVHLDEAMCRAAIGRLAEVEVADTVMVNSPIYRLMSIDLEPDAMRASVTLSDYASFALTADLMELELVDAVAAAGISIGPGSLPARDRCMPSVQAAKAFESRHAAGGPAALLAIARPARGDRPPDYALLIQERSGRVLNAAGKLAVIPKAFHQPIGEPAEEALLSATVVREFEEELLGRQDLEQLSPDSWRRVDILHAEHRSAPMTWLLEHHGEAFRTECTSFGINLVTGTYEFGCLLVVDDESWWEQWGHLVEANWEAMRVHRYSSRDTAGLASLARDPRWSNEGLFAFLEGLRRLSELDQNGRVAIPTIELLEG
jgi:hypothetical protein